MRRVVLASWLVILTATAGGGVWAAQRVSSKPCVPEVPADVSSLAPAVEHPLAAGRIVALDARSGRVVIAHVGIGYLYLDPGKTVFHVQDKSLLTGLSPGDKVRFDVERDGKQRFAITRLENSN